MKKNKKIEKEKYIDGRLFEFIQPQGGITFKEPNYIITGDGYVKVIHIYKLPTMLKDFWLSDLMNIEGTTSSIDIATKDTIEVKKTINKALQEEFARENAATNFAEIYDARERQKQLTAMFNELQSMGEIVKLVHFRIFVAERSLFALEEKASKITGRLESDQYMGSVFLNEGEREWKSLYNSYEKQHEELFCIKAHTLMTEQLAGGDPFDYSDLLDPFGTFLGFTQGGGPVIFDEFHNDEKRNYYNMLCVGDMGSGKSTLLKKRFRARAERGDFIRAFDVSGEFTDLTNEFGGRIISCDGKNGILNPLEILKAGDDDFTSFASHISKLRTFFKCFMPAADDDMLISLENTIREFYEELNLIPDEEKAITALPAKNYPILGDFLNSLDKKIKELTKKEGMAVLEAALFKKEIMQLSRIKDTVKNLVTNYGRIFNGYTTIDNLVDERIVTFNISSIKDLGNAFEGQLFNMVSLCWDNGISNGIIMKKMVEDGEMSLENATKFFIIIDESHRWINTRLPMILKLIIDFMREGRKYFIGIFLASQSIRDFIPEGTGSENLDLIKLVFELSQYKFLFRQDSSTLPLMDSIFNNALTSSQREAIPMLGRGECILIIKGLRNVKLDVWLSKNYEEKLFRGGK